MCRGWLACVVAAVVVAVHAAPARSAPPGLVREERTVIVNGVREIWRLEWDGPSEIACGADSPSVSLTCPCSGFAYGEQGKLVLIRTLLTGQAEKLDLGPLFVRDEMPGNVVGPAVLQRWPPNYPPKGNDIDIGGADPEFMSEAVRRGSTDVMRFADYDHDGMATEFLLQVGTLPCGKHQMVLVGISKRNPHLHVFSSVEAPQTPLMLGAWQWDALLKAKGPINTVSWPCGDHGSELEWTDEVSAQDGLLHDVKRSRKCTQSEQENAPFDSKPSR